MNLSNTSYTRHYSKLQRVILVHKQSVLNHVYVTNPGVIQGWANPEKYFCVYVNSDTLLNPYTESKVLSMVLSTEYVVKRHHG